jgi:hypothetical protein
MQAKNSKDFGNNSNDERELMEMDAVLDPSIVLGKIFQRNGMMRGLESYEKILKKFVECHKN